MLRESARFAYLDGVRALAVLAVICQTWSLGIEWLFYLTWPVVVMVWQRRGGSPGTLARASVVVGALLYVVPATFLDWATFYFLPLPRFGEILLGAALALWYVDHRPRAVERRPRQALLLVVALLVLAAYVVVGGDLPYAVARVGAVPLAALTTVLLIHHAYTARRGPLHALLGHRALAALGRASYSLYLWHWLPVYLLDKDRIALPTPVLAVLGVAMAAGLTWVSHALLERPFTRPRGDLLAPREAATPAGPAGPAMVTGAGPT